MNTVPRYNVTMLHVKCFFWGVGVKIYLHKHCLLYGRRPKWPDKKWKKFFSPKAPGHLFEKLPECTYLASRLGWLSDFLLCFSSFVFPLYLISFPFVSPSVSSNSDCYFVLLGFTFFLLLANVSASSSSKSDAFVCLILFWLFDFFLSFCPLCFCLDSFAFKFTLSLVSANVSCNSDVFVCLFLFLTFCLLLSFYTFVFLPLFLCFQVSFSFCVCERV